MYFSNLSPELEVMLSDFSRGQSTFFRRAPRLYDPEQMRTLLGAHDPQYVKRIAERLRFHDIQSVTHAYRILKKNPELALVLSVNASGYVREHAVRAITQITSPFALALLLLRLNDWVVPVRSAAGDQLNTLITNQSIPSECIIGCLEILLASDRFGRLGKVQTDIISRLLDTLSPDETIPNYIIGIKDDRSPKMMQQALRSDILDDMLASIAKNAKHPRTRALALSAALTKRHSYRQDRQLFHRGIDVIYPQVEMASGALSEKSAIVLHTALKFVVQNPVLAKQNQDRLTDLLLHPSNKVSEQSSFALREIGFEVQAHLRQQIKNPTLCKRAAMKLGQVGDLGDGNFLFDLWQKDGGIEYLIAAAVCTHKDAIAALQEHALNDENIAHARQCSKVLRRMRMPFSWDLLNRALENLRYQNRSAPLEHRVTFDELQNAPLGFKTAIPRAPLGEAVGSLPFKAMDGAMFEAANLSSE